MEYSVVVRTNSVAELVNEVNRLITNGFRPIGGICAVQEEDRDGNGAHVLFLQAVTLGSRIQSQP
jgi:hypothetical protein